MIPLSSQLIPTLFLLGIPRLPELAAVLAGFIFSLRLARTSGEAALCLGSACAVMLGGMVAMVVGTLFAHPHLISVVFAARAAGFLISHLLLLAAVFGWRDQPS